MVIFGRSLGGAVAGNLATQRAAMGLFAEILLPSIEAVARHHYMGLPMHWLLGAAFRIEKTVCRIFVAEVICAWRPTTSFRSNSANRRSPLLKLPKSGMWCAEPITTMCRRSEASLFCQTVRLHSRCDWSLTW